MKRTVPILLVAVALVAVLAGCRNETQNRIRRSIQDFTNQRMYVTIYSYDGKEIFKGQVDGKVTRSSATSEGTGENSQGYYLYWYDERGRYYQTDLPYMLTTYDLNVPGQAPPTTP